MINIKLNKTREELIKMYIESLNEGIIPWRYGWNHGANINGTSKIEYKGINQLILNYKTYKENYSDNRWYTYKQIQDLGLKLTNAKGKGAKIEFWSVYNYKLKKRFNFTEYEKYIKEKPDEKENFRILSKTATVFNGSLIEGLEPNITRNNNIETSEYISKIIKKLGVQYEERGNQAYYNFVEDKITLPEKNKFIDKYSYYATQLHEICHATGNVKRLNRCINNKNKEEYAREELVAEISSSFVMQNLSIPTNAEHYDNHKAYIQSWISILNDKPNELFKAISEANKVEEYIDEQLKIKTRDKGER